MTGSRPARISGRWLGLALTWAIHMKLVSGGGWEGMPRATKPGVAVGARKRRSSGAVVNSFTVAENCFKELVLKCVSTAAWSA